MLLKTLKTYQNVRILPNLAKISANYRGISHDTRPKFHLEQSYVSVGSNKSLLPFTMAQVLQRGAKMFGSDEALVVPYQGNLRLSFEQMRQESDVFAAGLLELGLAPGDRLGIWGVNSYEWCLAFLGATQIGIIVVNVNPAYQPAELEYCLNLAGIKALICSESFRTRNYYDLVKALLPEVENSAPGRLEAKAAPELKHVIMMADKEYKGAMRFKEVFELGAKADLGSVHRATAQTKMDDPCNIQFTSGTTGSPKGATLSHHSIINNSYFAHLRSGLSKRPNSVCLCPPMYHCFGVAAGLVSAIVHGFKLVLPSPHFDAMAALKTIQEEKLTYIYGTPTMYLDMLRVQREDKFDLGSVNSGIIAGAPVPPELGRQMIKELNMKNFVVAYGQTETSPLSFMGFPEDEEELKVSTIGFVMEHTEVKVIDDHGQVVPAGTPGELCVRGYLNMLGYWNNEQKTKETIKEDRWLYSGDQAVIYPNGYGQIVGRLKDMVIRGGENIYPKEIEEALHEHPSIAEAHVIGVPDERMGEELCAWVRLNSGEILNHAQMKEFLKKKLAHFKIPRYLHLTETFPVTVTGKVQKFVMREESVKMIHDMMTS